MLQAPWFILLSIAQVRMSGTSALPAVKLIDLCIRLPAFFGLVVAVVLQPRHGPSGGLWLWGGAVARAGISALFIKACDGLRFRERSGSNHSGEFPNAAAQFFVPKPPDPPPPERSMDEIRAEPAETS